MLQSDTAWTAWLYSVQCLELEQDWPVIAYFKWINSVLRWNVIVMQSNKTLCCGIRRILTIFYTGATGIIRYFNLLKYIPTRCCTGRGSAVPRGDQIPVGARFSTPVQTGPGAYPASFTMAIGSFPGVERPRRCWPPTSSSAEVKERIELYLCSPYGPSWPVLGWALPLPLLVAAPNRLV